MNALCSVGVALAIAHLRGALVMTVVDESSAVVGAVARETLERSSRFSSSGAVMTTFAIELRWRFTVGAPAPVTIDMPAPPAAEECRPAA